MNLRPYQLEAVDSIFREWEDGNRSTLVVMPTGCGKTIVFSNVIQRMQTKRVMVLAHRQELIFQAKDKIEAVTGLKAEIEMGEYRTSSDGGWFHPKAQVIVSTVQTHTAGGDGRGRMSKFDPDDFGLLILDEAHRGVSASFKRVIEYYQRNSKLVVLGVTATPDRPDEEALGQIFDSVAYDYEILDAIKDGWLVPIEQQFVTVESLDFSGIRTQLGDLHGADLDAVMLSEKNLHGVASSTLQIIGDKKGVGFASSVNHARILSDIFNRHRQGMSAWVSGNTDKGERKRIISDFAAGKIQWLWNCDVFSEGFDESGIEVIAQARPTKSRLKYAQQIGRGTRPHHSIAHELGECESAEARRAMIQSSVKPGVLVIDFCGNSGKHKLMTTADILGGKVSDAIVEAAIASARKSGRPVRMDVSIEEEEKRAEERKKRELLEQARKARIVGKASFASQFIDPFDLLQIKAAEPRGWDSQKQLSEKMRQLLRKAGFNPDAMDYAKGKQLCGILIDRWNRKLCSLKQAKLLKKYGYPTDLSFDSAKKIIDSIAANGWRRNGLPPLLARSESPVTIPPRRSEPTIDVDIPF